MIPSIPYEIRSIDAYQVYDSRGNPPVEAEVVLENGATGRGTVQIGTVSETLDAIRLVRKAGWAPVISAHSGGTEDTFIAYLAVATDAGQLKVGSFSRSERMAKWNEVLRIRRTLGSEARFSGAAGLFGAGWSVRQLPLTRRYQEISEATGSYRG